jgi:hypothetical protein
VLVTDNGATGDGQGGRTLGDPRTVLGARVHFAVDGGSSSAVFSDVDGLATFSWTAVRTPNAGDEELHIIRASGFGIGTAETDGPFDALGATPTLLGIGQVEFRVCVLPKLEGAPGIARVTRSVEVTCGQ